MVQPRLTGLFISVEAGATPRTLRRRARVLCLRLLFLFIACAAWALPAEATCAAPQNPIETENCLPGTPVSQWYVIGAGSPNIVGFSTDISVDAGQTIFFKVSTAASQYRIDIYRMGYYQGNGGRFIGSITPSAPLPQTQPACLSDRSTGLTDCGNWALSASWPVPSTAVSGVYFARLLRLDTGDASPILFVVRNDSSHSDILVQTCDPTWHAYNDYGGNSLYTGSPEGRAYKVSYNRPFNVPNMYTWFFSAEYPMLRWLEANGYDVTYFTGVDTDRSGKLITQHKLFISVGHDEYWSAGQRASVEAARDSGVNLAFFSGNEVAWKTRWEPSIDGSNTPYRTLVCYKETSENTAYDPADPPTWTGLWQDTRFSPPADGGRPENALTGTLFGVNEPRNDAITVPQADGRMRFWRNTSIATLAPGQFATLPTGVLGYEWDVDEDNGFRPAGLIPLSTTSLMVPAFLLNYQFVVHQATHHLTLYRAPSKALVFGAGTVQWSWGLDTNHAIAGTPADPDMQQATVNLFADMGIQPATLESGLLPATASTDTTPPASTITSPVSGSTIASPVTISGTAADFGGGVVGAVEVSVDGGKSWHPAVGRENWSYTYARNDASALQILSRAVDDSGNLESPTAGATVTVSNYQPSVPLSVITTSLPNAVQSISYGQALAVAGGVPPFGWWLVSGSLPKGLGLSADGMISGTPAIVGTSNFTLGVTDSSVPPQKATQPLSINTQAPSSAPSPNDAQLKGDYAFTFNGITGSATYSSVFGAVGRFTADGAGHLTSGELDTNGIGPGATVVAQLFTGTYTIGSDNRGLMTLDIAGGAKLAFVMLANGNARFIEFDAAGGTGTIGSGTMEKADTTAFDPAKITGDYAFGFAGLDDSNNRAALAGRFTSNGTGTLSNLAGDVNAYGTPYALVFAGASYTVTDRQSGRGTMSLAFSINGAQFALNFVAYVVNAGKLFAMEQDAVTSSTPLFNGAVMQQQIPAGGFSNASLNGNVILYATGLASCVSGAGPAPVVLLGSLVADGNGAVSLNYDENCGGVTASGTGLPGSYAVSGNGRVSLAAGNGAIAYLVSPNQAFLFGADGDVLSGFAEPQAAGPLSNGQLKGTYAGFTASPASFTVAVFSGAFSADGASPIGTLTSVQDISSAGGTSSGIAATDAYSILSSPTNGRGTLTDSTGSEESAIVYLISPTRFAALSLSTPSPAVMIFDASLPPTASSLSGLTVNPSNVTGGSSSTGTVTLNAPAPSGGAVVALSGNNPAAGMPASVTVAAGATSATFAVSTSSVGTSTSVTISATFGGSTLTASLTVLPPQLTSLTLNPVSVTGARASSGTVALNAPAPAGGLAVTLSSSNQAAASAPATVTVAAGATSATFAVSTSPVITSTAVTISASFGGATLTASLTVLPPQLSSLTLNPASLTGGSSSTGTVTLNAPAPSGGALVALSGNNPAAAGMPASVTVAAGATSATFAVSTSPMVTSTAITISATFGGATLTASLTVLPPQLSSLSLNPASVPGGGSSTGTVTLSGPAPSGGVLVSLSSSNGLVAGVPPSVTVAPGSATARFPIGTLPVLVQTKVSISAHYGSVTLTAILTVSPL